MESYGESLESLSDLCNYSHWQALKNDPGSVLTPREKNITANCAGGVLKAVIAVSLPLPQPAKPNPESQGCALMSQWGTSCSLPPLLWEWVTGV